MRGKKPNRKAHWKKKIQSSLRGDNQEIWIKLWELAQIWISLYIVAVSSLSKRKLAECSNRNASESYDKADEDENHPAQTRAHLSVLSRAYVL